MSHGVKTLGRTKFSEASRINGQFPAPGRRNMQVCLFVYIECYSRSLRWIESVPQ